MNGPARAAAPPGRDRLPVERMVADRAESSRRAIESAAPNDEHPRASRGVDEASDRGGMDCAALNCNHRKALDASPDVPNEIVVHCFRHLIE